MTRMVVLTTERLVLREMTGADLDHIAALFGDEEVMRYYPKPMTRDEARSWVEWNQRLYRSQGFGLWALRHGTWALTETFGSTDPDGTADAPQPRPPGTRRVRRTRADLVEGGAWLDVGDGVVEQPPDAVLVGVGHDTSSITERSAATPRDAWLLTAPRLMPRVSAISASDRSR